MSFFTFARRMIEADVFPWGFVNPKDQGYYYYSGGGQDVWVDYTDGIYLEWSNPTRVTIMNIDESVDVMTSLEKIRVYLDAPFEISEMKYEFEYASSEYITPPVLDEDNMFELDFDGNPPYQIVMDVTYEGSEPSVTQVIGVLA